MSSPSKIYFISSVKTMLIKIDKTQCFLVNFQFKYTKKFSIFKLYLNFKEDCNIMKIKKKLFKTVFLLGTCLVSCVNVTGCSSSNVKTTETTNKKANKLDELIVKQFVVLSPMGKK